MNFKILILVFALCILYSLTFAEKNLRKESLDENSENFRGRGREGGRGDHGGHGGQGRFRDHGFDGDRGYWGDRHDRGYWGDRFGRGDWGYQGGHRGDWD